MPPSRIFHLRNLSLDCKFALITSPAPTAPSSILAHIRSSSAPISSFTLKLSDGQIQVADSFVQELLNAHGATLRSIAFLNCAVSIDSIKSISRRAIRLERLHVPVPVKEFVSLVLYKTATPYVPNLRLPRDHSQPPWHHRPL